MRTPGLRASAGAGAEGLDREVLSTAFSSEFSPLQSLGCEMPNFCAPSIGRGYHGSLFLGGLVYRGARSRLHH